MKQLRDIAEAFALWLFFFIFRLLPLDIASALGDTFGRTIGPFFAPHKNAQVTVAKIYPERSRREINALLGHVWGHVGRVIGEYPSLSNNRLLSRVTVIGGEHLPRPGSPAIFFTGPVGNWELLAPIAQARNVDLSILYTPFSNPHMDRMLSEIRGKYAQLITKKSGAHEQMSARLKQGGSVGMIADERLAHIIAELALTYHVPIIPARVMRTKDARFKCTIYPPLTHARNGDAAQDREAITVAINEMLEGWQREHPEQWGWVI